MAYTASGVCPFCNGSLKHMSREELTGLSRAIEAPKSQKESFASVKFCNGAYEASIGDVRAFGGTKEEALKKLAVMVPGQEVDPITGLPVPGKPVDPVASLEELQSDDAGEQSEKIREILEGNPQVPVANPAEQIPGQPEAPQAIPPVRTDEDINKDIEETWGALSPEELAELEGIQEAAGAGPDPKSDLL